jgi:hypothetical protein
LAIIFGSGILILVLIENLDRLQTVAMASQCTWFPAKELEATNVKMTHIVLMFCANLSQLHNQEVSSGDKNFYFRYRTMLVVSMP